MPTWKLTIEDDEGQKTVLPLVRDEYSIGRREAHPIRLTERNVSRDHARLRRDADRFVIEDLKSYNGVFVNGLRLEAAQPLQSGDIVLIGDYRLELYDEEGTTQIAQPAVVPSQEPPPPAAAEALDITSADYPTAIDRPHRLIILMGAEFGREFPLEAERMVVGRGDGCEIRIQHSSVSRQHCEVLRTAPSTFDVVDLGSANGIRVNGQDARRKQLQPGDVIELGDVHLKYVPAGQAFIFDPKDAERALKARQSPKAATWIVLSVLIVLAAVIGVVIGQRARPPEPISANVRSLTPPATAEPASDGPLTRAVRLLHAGEVERAHAELAGLPTESELRRDPRFLQVENAWADWMLGRAKKQTDVHKRRRAFEAILRCGADDEHREAAREQLAALDAQELHAAAMPSTAASEVTASSSAATTSSAAPSVAATAAPSVPVPPAVTVTASTAPSTTTRANASTPAAAPTSPAPATSPAKAAISATSAPKPSGCAIYQGNYRSAFAAGDHACVRSILLPRADTISAAEATYLKAACTELGDSACQKRAAARK